MKIFFYIVAFIWLVSAFMLLFFKSDFDFIDEIPSWLNTPYTYAIVAFLGLISLWFLYTIWRNIKIKIYLEVLNLIARNKK